MADPRKTATDPSEPTQLHLRITRGDRAALERVQAARGDDTLSDTLRALPVVWTERERLVWLALDGVRGRLSPGEVDAILDVKLLGGHLLAEVVDGIRLNGLAKKHRIDGDKLVATVQAMSRVERAAIELWASTMWRRHEDDDFWSEQRKWLGYTSTKPTSSGSE